MSRNEPVLSTGVRRLITFFCMAAVFAVWASGILPTDGSVWLFRGFMGVALILCAILVRPPRSNAIYGILAMMTALALTASAADLLMRVTMAKRLYYREQEMFSRRWPSIPVQTRFKPNVRYEGLVSGDMAAISQNSSLREMRKVLFMTDSRGFRNDAALTVSDAEVIALGDSYGTGSGTTQHATWASLLGERYHHGVYNLSFPGSPWNSYINLQAELENRPNKRGAIVLLALFSGNDLDETYGETNKLSEIPRNGLLARWRVRFDTFRHRSPIRQLTGVSPLASAEHDVIVKQLPGDGRMTFFRPYVRASERSKNDIVALPAYGKMIRVLKDMHAFCDARGMELRICLFPSKEEVYRWVLRGSSAWSTPATPSPLSGLLAEFCRENRIAYYDLGPGFVKESRALFAQSKKSLYWSDDTHWNTYGHGLAARLIEEGLLRGAGASSAAGGGGGR